MKTNKIALLLFFSGLLAFMAGCGGQGEPAAKTSAGSPGHKIKVYATIYPLYDFASSVGGDRVEVASLLPPGAEPHHWEPGPKEMAGIEKADIFVYCGAGLEPWVGGVLKNTGSKRTVVDASRGARLLHYQEDGNHQGEEKAAGSHAVSGTGANASSNASSNTGAAGGAEQDARGAGAKDPKGVGQYARDDEEHGAHGQGDLDPHIWLDPQNAAIMVDNIVEALVRADPSGREYYVKNAAAYKEELARLDSEYRAALGGAAGKKIVVSHAAFGYLATRYGLEQVAVRGLTSESEPTPAKMAEIVKVVRDNDIKYIFFESLVSPGVSQAIARETGAGTLVLNPLAGITRAQMEAGMNYLTGMRENLANIKLACQAR